MHIHPGDKAIIQWALDRGLVFRHARDQGLGGDHLRVYIGLVTACFRRGKLLHLSAAADGHRIDALMRDFTALFGLCAMTDGYLEPSDRTAPPPAHAPNEASCNPATSDAPELYPRRLTG